MASKKKPSSKKTVSIKKSNNTNKIKIDDYNDRFGLVADALALFNNISEQTAASKKSTKIKIIKKSVKKKASANSKVSTKNKSKSKLVKEDISQHIEIFKDTLNNCKKKVLSLKNCLNDNALIEECNALEKEIEKQLKNAKANLSKDIKKALNKLNDIVDETNKLYSEASNIKEKINSINQKCMDKLKEIKELSKDFEYAIKNDYHKDCDDIEKRLNNGIDNKNELNKIIDEINNLYRNAYNKKHNKSSLAYIMDVEEDDIDLIENI